MTNVVRRNIDNRSFKFATSEESASKSIGELKAGCEIFGISKGQFSKIDIIKHCIKHIGACDVVVATWTASNADISSAEMLLKNKDILSLKLMLDRSFPTRQPKYFEKLIKLKGVGVQFCLGNSHAKFVTLRNDNWNIAIRTSMNLNKNRRIESFEISDSKALCDYLDEVVNFCLENQEKSSTQILNEFKVKGSNIKVDKVATQEKLGAW